ncbi:MAG TPA: tetratricopeptide repeat protein [Tepidisphaeraceae bacterium]|jgi:predicted O-linked N-acetylglucosamine transferase (SPINDLY family)|nr:tetratricopeptide repeat protein [Tepidisphaeraceae bacterium]
MSPSEIHELFVIALGLHNSGKLSDAEKIYQSILAAHPDHPDAIHLLGFLAHQRGQCQLAAHLVQKAIRINPRNSEYYATLGAAFLRLGQYLDCIKACGKAVAMNPRLPHALNSLGLALIRVDDAQPAAAAAAARSALALENNRNPEESYRILGAALSLMGQPSEAAAAFRESLRLQPDCSDVRSDLIFTMQHDPACDEKTIAAELAEWNRLHVVPLRHLIQPHHIDRSPDRRLRIGWVSADFCQHVLAYCVLPIFQEFDSNRFKNFCYSSVLLPDDMTDRIRGAVDTWRDICQVSDQRAAEIIRSDRIDILVDLGLHSGGNRVTLFALKPAPIQVSYLGYCGSTGLETMDYRISDPYIDPPDSDLSRYSERTVFLPDSFLLYRPMMTPPDVSPLPSLSEGCVTFGCLNSFTKVSRSVLLLWAQIMRAAPASRLLLHAPPGGCQQQLLAEFQHWGLSPDRFQFVPHQSWKGYIETYNRIDIALDPFPYGGGVTTCDALLMGVPVIALRGTTAAGRLSYSILCNIGRSDLAADTPQRYVEIAAALAANPARLFDLRSNLRLALQTSPVMDPSATAVNLGNLFLEIWEKYLRNTAPTRLNE